ncbi:hypothetical protein MBLNU459_g4053t1 [Dothideomycetes sp. NU459]
MAPIRRYLRITRYSVLEVRIYLDNPALAHTWLLNSRDPVLPRVIEAVRPLVLPKLREENENAKRKGGKKKKKGVRDVVAKDDFEVSIFLTETSTTHALLTKQKTFSDKPRLKSTSSKLTNFGFNTADNAITIEDEGVPPVLLEEDAEETSLSNIPEAAVSHPKRARNDEDDPIFVQSDEDEGDDFEHQIAPPTKRKKIRSMGAAGDEAGEDDKKKMALSTAYEGFSIYGRILCLIVKRKGVKKTTAAAGNAAGSQMLENWVSTQANKDDLLDDGEDVG